MNQREHSHTMCDRTTKIESVTDSARALLSVLAFDFVSLVSFVSLFLMTSMFPVVIIHQRRGE